MKIIILTASLGAKTKSVPKCFTTTIGSVALIEYLVRTLGLLGILSKNIYLVTSDSKKWGNQKYHDIIFSLNIHEVLIKKKSFFSFPSLVACLKKIKTDNILLINGDNYFKLSELEYLLKNSSKNSVVLVQKRNSVLAKEPVLEISKNRIVKVNSVGQSNKVPWYAYYGAMIIKKSDVNLIKKKKPRDTPYILYFVNNLNIKLDFKDISSFLEKNDNDKLKELSGGSFANLRRTVLVLKKAEKNGRDKLEKEIKWIKNLEEKVSYRFPAVIDSNVTTKEAWYTMPWYTKDSLRKKIITGVFDIPTVTKYMNPIMNFLWNDLYADVTKNPGIHWVNKKHFQRFYSRLINISGVHPFSKIIKLKEIVINGNVYKNLSILVDWLKEFNDKTNFFVPNVLKRIHGDLHFQNILIGKKPSDFLLADPRGDLEGLDIYYDMGKLWHSFNGKYDLIHTDISRTEVLGDKYSNYKLCFGPQYLLDTYSSIKITFENMMNNYPISKDKNWKLKTEFSEFMHFSSLVYFHLKQDKIENRGLSLYLSSVILGSKLIDQLKKL